VWVLLHLRNCADSWSSGRRDARRVMSWGVPPAVEPHSCLRRAGSEGRGARAADKRFAEERSGGSSRAGGLDSAGMCISPMTLGPVESRISTTEKGTAMTTEDTTMQPRTLKLPGATLYYEVRLGSRSTPPWPPSPARLARGIPGRGVSGLREMPIQAQRPLRDLSNRGRFRRGARTPAPLGTLSDAA